MEFASNKYKGLQKWLKSALVTIYDQLVNSIEFEEFKRKVPLSVVMQITSRDETDLLKVAEIADVFSLIHRPGPVGERKAESIVKLPTPSEDIVTTVNPAPLTAVFISAQLPKLLPM